MADQDDPPFRPRPPRARASHSLVLGALVVGLLAPSAAPPSRAQAGGRQAQPTSPPAGAAAPTPTPDRQEFAAGRVVVRLARPAVEARALAADVQGRVQASGLEALGIYVLEVPEGRELEAISSLRARFDVAWAEVDPLVYAVDLDPNDTYYWLQWGLRHIGAPSAWDLDTGSAAVTIAVLDTGVDLAHADLAPKIVPGWDFFNEDADPQDDSSSGHGTHAAGIAAAATNNGIGVAGVSWGARIMPLKVLNEDGVGTHSMLAAGLVWAADAGAEVASMSLGSGIGSPMLQAGVDYAVAAGMLLVAAAGNCDPTCAVQYPAAYPDVIGVGAIDSDHDLAWFSSFGPEVSVVAPGVSILSTCVGDSYCYKQGTSMATPFVSGAAAVLRGVPGACGVDEIVSVIESTALDLGPAGRDDTFGYGLIQLDAALATLLGYPSFGDVSYQHWACAHVRALAAGGLTAGCGGGYYCPDSPASRAEMTVFLKKGIHGASYAPPAPDGSAPFGDITSHWAQAWIEDAYDEGLTVGYPDGTFQPNGSVTRAEIAVFLLRARHGAGYMPPPPAGGAFSDVAGHWAETWIEQLQEEGIASGYPDGSYRPENPVTRAEMAVVLTQAFGLSFP